MAISLRTVALDTPIPAPRATVFDPTGWPVSTYSSINALRMAALRSSMALPSFYRPRGARRDAVAPLSRTNGPSTGVLQQPGRGLVGQKPAPGGEDDAVVAMLGQTVGDEPVRLRTGGETLAGAEGQHGRLSLLLGA